ncbi:transposable element Tcb1 transposase [Trichonephila clavipes]|nr:transposable element Tcb1 transposase [Trichonephila clavipes]
MSVCAYHSTPFTAEGSVRQTSIVWSALDAKPQKDVGRGNGMKLSLLTSHASVCNTTMVGFQSGDTVEIECCSAAALCTPDIMVWGGIGYYSRTPLVRIAGTLNS